jgi:putative membrane protein
MDHSASPVQASFNPLIRPFLVLRVGLFLIATVAGIPLAIIWFLGIGQWWAGHYFARLECRLTDRSLVYRKGIFIQTEKTIPLENIQDVTFIEGPILRHFNLSILRFETAGQSMHHSADTQLIGIVDAAAFRATILARREALRHARQAHDSAGGPAADQLQLLGEINDKLGQMLVLLRERA